MKLIKKIVCIMLSLAIVLSCIIPTMNAQASTSKTADDAIAWAKSKVGQSVGYNDGSGYYQCVEFIQAYYDYLVGYHVSGNGCNYSWNNLPDGWTRTKGGTPQKGDILVYSAYSSSVQQYGHVAIYESNNSLYDQDGAVKYATVKHETKNYRTYTYSYWGCIHPNFAVANPSVSFLSWDNSNYTYVNKTDAAIGQEINVSNGSCSEVGMYLYNSSGSQLGHASNSYYYRVYYKINEELGVTLSPGTTYKYKFYAVVNGQMYWSDMKSFTTTAENWQKISDSTLSVTPGTSTDYTVLQVTNANTSKNTTAYDYRIYKTSDMNNAIKTVYCSHDSRFSINLPAGNYVATVFPINEKIGSSERSWGNESNKVSFTVKEGNSNVANSVEYNGHKYELYKLVMPWDEAKAFCEAKGGHLATITSAAENNVVKNLANGQYVFLGASDSKTEGTWKWNTDEAFSYINWASGQPDNYHRLSTDNGEDYLMMYGDGTWNDEEEVSGTIYFVCEYDNVNVSVSYDANGGTGAPDAQDAKSNTALTISSTVPTRDGYHFLGWSTNKNATIATYKAGDSITVNGETTLYAVWETHDWVMTNDTPATCTEYESKDYECSICGETKHEIVEYSEWSETKLVGVDESLVESKDQYREYRFAMIITYGPWIDGKAPELAMPFCGGGYESRTVYRYKLTLPGHTFDNGNDATCNVCGYTRVVDTEQTTEPAAQPDDTPTDDQVPTVATTNEGITLSNAASTTCINKGDKLIYTVTLNEDIENVKSSNVVVTLGNGLKLVADSEDSNTWKLSNATIATFNTENGKGAFAFSENTTIEAGTIFTFEVEATEENAAANVKVDFNFNTLDQDSREVSLKKASVSVDLMIVDNSGDLDGNNSVDSNDAIYLLMHTQFSSDYELPTGISCDFDGNGEVNSDDAIYLLMNTQFGDAEYPLHN